MIVGTSLYLLLCLGTTFFYSSFGGSSDVQLQNTTAGCPAPFYNIGGRCIHIETTTNTWSAMRVACLNWGSDLLKLDSADLMYDLVNYVNDMGYSGRHYWIGGQDKDNEGVWIYPDGSDMKMGTPFWANSYDENIQQPQGGTGQNCAMIDYDFHYFVNDFECETKQAALCEIAASVQKDEEPVISSAPSCPSPFYDVGGRCVIIDNLTSGSWYDMRIHCLEIGSDLVRLDSGDFMYDLVNYINSKGMSGVHYWIGGTDENNEGHWIYPDGAIMKMGTPFWANSYDEQVQQPQGGTEQNCALLDAGLHYYVIDLDCSYTHSVICEKPSMKH